ncbi:hypothetical protein B7494_g4040 [Chlorociboria aeruginascens]|nr:hypothetical protein B7494_g4040 [Chlorociboria aeruginascens]
MSSSPPTKNKHHPLKVGDSFEGQGGTIYTIQDLLLDRKDIGQYVYKARCEQQSLSGLSEGMRLPVTRTDGNLFVAKTLSSSSFNYYKDIQSSLASCPNLRVFEDSNPELQLYVYSYLKTNALQAVGLGILREKDVKRSLLKSVLTGLAAMHEKNIVHNDVKPNNILLDHERTNGVTKLRRVQLADLEDSVKLPLGKCLYGGSCGNQFWRSPESWAKARQGTESDIFSFGIVAIYVMLRNVIFFLDGEDANGPDAWAHILRRHLSFFGDEAGLAGFLEWIGKENRYYEPLLQLESSFVPEAPRQPFQDVERKKYKLFMHNVLRDYGPGTVSVCAIALGQARIVELKATERTNLCSLIRAKLFNYLFTIYNIQNTKFYILPSLPKAVGSEDNKRYMNVRESPRRDCTRVYPPFTETQNEPTTISEISLSDLDSTVQ